jgi:hypothetical protein
VPVELAGVEPPPTVPETFRRLRVDVNPAK